MDQNEDLITAANRELSEETGLNQVKLNQFRAYSRPQRDPRTRVITVVFWGTLLWGTQQVQPGDDAREAQWWDIQGMPELAFDHREILDDVLSQLRLHVRSQPFGESLLPNPFAFTDLQRLYEAILGMGLDPAKFQKQLGNLPHLKKSSDPGSSWEFNLQKYRDMQSTGLCFDPEACF